MITTILKYMISATMPHMIQSISSFIRSYLNGFRTTVTSVCSYAGHIGLQENTFALKMTLLLTDAISSFLLLCMAKSTLIFMSYTKELFGQNNRLVWLFTGLWHRQHSALMHTIPRSQILGSPLLARVAHFVPSKRLLLTFFAMLS